MATCHERYRITYFPRQATKQTLTEQTKKLASITIFSGKVIVHICCDIHNMFSTQQKL